MKNNSIYTTELQAGMEIEVLNTKDMIKWLAHLLIYNDTDRLEKAIRNTYTKDDSNKIISFLNTLLEIRYYETLSSKSGESGNIEKLENISKESKEKVQGAEIQPEASIEEHEKDITD